MMGREDPPQPSLFYTSFNLDKRIRMNHPLRKVAKAIDFGFVSDEVEHLYGTNGNVSVPPPAILKLLVLLMLYNVRSALVGPGDENEAHRLMELIDGHHANTGLSVDTLVADKKYGTVNNFLSCDKKGIRAHMFPCTDTNKDKGSRKGIFPPSAFTYDPAEDTMVCPAGQVLTLRHRLEYRQLCEYEARKEACRACDLRSQCTRSKTGGRTVRRYFEQDRLDRLYATTRTRIAYRDIGIRQHFMERSFAEACRYGFKKARWRGQERIRIQDYLIAAVQNIRLLVTHGKLKPAAAGKLGPILEERVRALSFLARFIGIKPVYPITVQE